jgi:LacI family transcriptional regulator
LFGDSLNEAYNDIPIVSHLPTPLTTLRVPFDQIASAALDLLTSGPEADHERIRIAAPTLIPLKSTARLRAG